MSRPDRPVNARVSFREPSPDYYDDDDDDELDEEAEEQERLLSEKHGEAGEDLGSSRRKRSGGGGDAARETDQDIANELAGEAARRKKKARPALTVNDLNGSHGLSKIKNEFPDRVKYRPPGARARLVGGGRRGGARTKDRIKQQEREAAAAYGRCLMGAYRSFCQDLSPSQAFEDVLCKIETLGSKKEVKSYLQVMRDDTRKRHLEGIYGREKAESLLHELEHGLSHQGYDNMLLQTNSRAAAAAARDSEYDTEPVQEDMDMAPDCSKPQNPVANPYGTRSATVNTNQGGKNAEQNNDQQRQTDDLQDEEVEANLDEGDIAPNFEEQDEVGTTANSLKAGKDAALDTKENGSSPTTEESSQLSPRKGTCHDGVVEDAIVDEGEAKETQSDIPAEPELQVMDSKNKAKAPVPAKPYDDGNIQTQEMPLTDKAQLQNSGEKEQQSDGETHVKKSDIVPTQETATVIATMTVVGDTLTEERHSLGAEESPEVKEDGHDGMIVEYSQQEEEEDLVLDFTQNTETQTVVPTQNDGISQLSMDY